MTQNKFSPKLRDSLDGSEANMYNNKRSKTNLGIEDPTGTDTLHLGARFNASNVTHSFRGSEINVTG